MNTSWVDFIGGAAAGFLFCSICTDLSLPDLDECQKANDVYRCELVAVPVKEK